MSWDDQWDPEEFQPIQLIKIINCRSLWKKYWLNFTYNVTMPRTPVHARASSPQTRMHRWWNFCWTDWWSPNSIQTQNFQAAQMFHLVWFLGHELIATILSDEITKLIIVIKTCTVALLHSIITFARLTCFLQPGAIIRPFWRNNSWVRVHTITFTCIFGPFLNPIIFGLRCFDRYQFICVTFFAQLMFIIVLTWSSRRWIWRSCEYIKFVFVVLRLLIIRKECSSSVFRLNIFWTVDLISVKTTLTISTCSVTPCAIV